ncbi:MAG TPA: LptF/LptG family permease, partial [Phycisphaerae bacterium]|nr:LptF/LptG family permease [Phycisphaerae bacterium]
GEKLTYCGTAETARVDFTRNPEGGPPSVKAALYNVRALDMTRYQFAEFKEQAVNPPQIPEKSKLETKFMTLPLLLKYHRHPLELPSIDENLRKLHWLVREAQFYQWITRQLTGPNRSVTLADSRVSYEIRAERVGVDSRSLRPTLFNVTVKEIGPERRRRTYTAGECRLAMDRGAFGAGDSAVVLSLRNNVNMSDAAAPAASVTARSRWELDRVMLPADLPDLPPAVDQQTLLGDVSNPASLEEPLPTLNLGTRVDDARESDRKTIVKSALEIAGIIHSRLAFSSSTLVLLVLAAGLGIIFRGGQLLTAFVISFVPGMLVVVMNIMGRQLTENTGTHVIGITVIWAGIALLIVVDVVVLARFLKR